MTTELLLQPRRFKRPIEIAHELAMPPCCPVSKNPHEGSTVSISYSTTGGVLDVLYIPTYLRTFVNGKGEIRSAEDMADQIVDDVFSALEVAIWVRVVLEIVLANDPDGKPQCLVAIAEKSIYDPADDAS